MGHNRMMVRCLEDGKAKQFYTSRHGSLWKIDYKAGRKTD